MVIEKNKKNKSDFFLKLCCVFVIIFLVFIILFFTRGQIKTSGEYPDPVSSRTLVCENNGFLYPFFKYDNSISKSLKITAIFSENTIKTISLLHILYYQDASEVNASSNLNQGSFYVSFNESGFKNGDLGTNFSKQPDSLKFSLFAKKEEFTNNAAKVFLLDGTHFALNEYKSDYESKGFSCIVKE